MFIETVKKFIMLSFDFSYSIKEFIELHETRKGRLSGCKLINWIMPLIRQKNIPDLNHVEKLLKLL